MPLPGATAFLGVAWLAERHHDETHLLGDADQLRSAAYDGFAFDAEQFLAGPVLQNETKVACVLNEHYGEDVLDDRFEELPSAEQ